MARIFISYRRDDSGGWAGRLYDRLRQHFGRGNVFMDINTIEPGLDFVEVIERAAGPCNVLVALIGKQWLTITDASGVRRLDNLEDFVRLEIEAALNRNIRVIPALVQEARMPRSTELPDVLQKLARRHALDISDTRFHPDVDRLIEVLERVVSVAPPVSSQSALERPEASPPPSQQGAEVVEPVLGASKSSATQPASTVPDAKREAQIREARPPVIPLQSRKETPTNRLLFEPEMILIPAGEFLIGSDAR